MKTFLPTHAGFDLEVIIIDMHFAYIFIMYNMRRIFFSNFDAKLYDTLKYMLSTDEKNYE